MLQNGHDMSFQSNWKNAGEQSTTLASKLGFQDPDRKDPAHDEMVLWLDGLLRDPKVRAQFTTDYYVDKFQITWEHPIGDARWLAGFVDLCIRFSGIYSVYFEVKTKLPSLGDLIRQLRFYEAKTTYASSNLTMYVVSDDTRYVDVLRDQGIGFVEYPSGQITHPAERQE